ncbi:uncharacterized protein LOC110685290 isoform X2 [Chenopodium quinoa]|uniref:uncharacterized protein LOC110685290 isoform X2 n=1 Tax=Chenopodium quinoa TaxID=63459 RepID=UPI000B76CFFE|nr:uncharacterized protein LOC110685290 isoform X2 [Chenopodium quinoa]
MRVKSQATQSGDSSGSRQNVGAAYAQYLTNKSVDADASSRLPDLQQYAKRMLRTLTRSEKEAVPGVHQVNIDRINSLLAKVMLRVDDMMVPLRKKQEEEELIKELTADAETANKKAADFELQVKNLQPDVKALGEADKENTELRVDVSRLKNELAQTQVNHKAKLEAEQGRLISENKRDCEERMKMDWSLIHPDTDWAFFNLRYKYAIEVFDAQVLGTKKPAPFEEWAGIVEEEKEEQVEEQAQGETDEAQA